MPLFGPPNVEKMTQKRDVKGLIKALRYGIKFDSFPEAEKASEIRAFAAKALGELGNPRAVEPLMTVIHDPKFDVSTFTPGEHRFGRQDTVRKAAAEALIKIGEGAVNPLIAFLQDREEDVRCAAARILGSIGDIGATEPLIKALQDEDKRIRGAAAKSLGNLGSAQAVEPLIAALQDKSSGVRQCATEALGNLGSAQAVEPLIAVLQGRDKHVHQAAAIALSKIGDAAVKPLVTLLKDEKKGSPQQVVEALNKLGWQPGLDENAAYYWAAKREWERCLQIGDAAIQPLIMVIRNADGIVSRDAGSTLAKIGNAAVELLITEIQNEDKHVQSSVIKVLGEIGDARAVEPLIAIFQNKGEDRGVREASASALYSIDKRQAIVLFLKASLDLNEETHEIAEVHLNMRSYTAVEPLIATLQDTDWRVRKRSVHFLGKIGDARAVEPLIAAFEDKRADVRESVVKALESIGDMRVIAPLVDALNDDSKFVREVAAKALDKLGHVVVSVEPPIAMLQDKDKAARQVAAKSLEKSGWKPDTDESAVWYWIATQDWQKCVNMGHVAVKPLIALLQDDDDDVCKGAVGALGEIGDRQAVGPLIALLHEKIDIADRISLEQSASSFRAERQDRSPASLYLAERRDWSNKIRNRANEIRKAIAIVLGQIGDERATKPLIVMSRDKDKDVRRTAAIALRHFDRKATDILINDLKSADMDVRCAGIEALGRIGNTKAIDPLIDLLQDKDENIRKKAVAALVKIGDAAVESLCIMLLDENKAVRSYIIEILDTLGWKPDNAEAEVAAWYYMSKHQWKKVVEFETLAVPPLLVALKDKDADVRRAAAEALGTIGDTWAVKPLANILQKTYWQSPPSSIDIRSGQKKPHWYYEKQYKDWETELNRWNSARSAAANALGKTGGEHAVRSLIAALEDECVRRTAAEALAYIGDATVESLIKKLNNKDRDVRREVAKILVNFYRFNRISEELRKIILANRPHIEQHSDYKRHSDDYKAARDLAGGYHHVDHTTHTDTKLVDFPL